MKNSKRSVGIVGTGNVGVAGAFALFLERACQEIILVDLNEKRARGEALDLMHGQGLVGRIGVRAGGYSDLAECGVVVVTAGVGQKPGETRLQLLGRNAAVFRSIAKSLDEHSPDSVIVVASNPVDVLTYILQELSERPNERIIGTGTMLDTSRFRTLLGEYYGVNPRSVHGYILAEHGDSEFPAWSTVSIGGCSPIENPIFGKPYHPEELDRLFVQVRDAAYEIIEGKGYTNWAIGLVIAELVRIILDDRKSVQPISVRLNGEYRIQDVCVS
ncbi:MAG: L-lactate dehydrogenase, partial [Candidatus Omnitrophica bacterium]|nr:L-lactate dehydrogenase [Candidatus Omnitrophota bacterium]